METLLPTALETLLPIALPKTSLYGLKGKKSNLTIQVPAPLPPQYGASSPSGSYYCSRDKSHSCGASRSFVESPLSGASFFASGSSLISASPPLTPPSTAVRPTSALYDELATPTSSPAPLLYSSRPSSVGYPGSESHTLALVADELTRKLADVRQNLTHERRYRSQKLSNQKKTIDLKEESMIKSYNEIQRLKAKDDACSKMLMTLEIDLARLHEDLDSLREEYSRLEKDSHAQITVLEDQRDDLFREKEEKIRQLAESETSTRQCGLYISHNNIEGNGGAVFTNWVVNMGCTRYLLPFLSPLSFLDQLEEFLSLPYIPLSLPARGSFPGRRGGLHNHGVCVAESGTGLTFLSAQLIDESLRSLRSSFDIQEVDGDDLRILFGEEEALPPDDDSSPNNAVLFAFCGHRNGDVTPNLFNISGLFLAVLASKLDPSHPVRRELNMRREHEDQLRQREISKVLIEASRSFDHISIFLDAVHKLPEGSLPSLLTTLKRMTPRRGVSLFLTRSPHACPQDPVSGTWRFRPKRRELRQFIKAKLLSDRAARPQAMNNRLLHFIVNTLSTIGSFKGVVMALEAILEKPTIDSRIETLQRIPHSSQHRDDVIYSRRRVRKPASLSPNAFSFQVERRKKLNAAPQAKRVEAGLPHAGQVGTTERSERVLRRKEEFEVSSSHRASQIRVLATNTNQCQGLTLLGERCLKLTSSEFCHLHTRCKGITNKGTHCKRNGPKDGFCFQYVK